MKAAGSGVRWLEVEFGSVLVRNYSGNALFLYMSRSFRATD